jgi:hypothetical protein
VIGVAPAVIAHGSADGLGDGCQVANDFFDRFAHPRRMCLKGIVKVGHIGRVMLPMVDFHRARIDVRL